MHSQSHSLVYCEDHEQNFTHKLILDDENIEGPYYIHLGSANSIKSIRELMEERLASS